MYNNKLPALKLLGTAQSLTSAATIASYAAEAKLLVKRISFVVKTAAVSTGGIVITFYKRPTIFSTAGQASVGTLTIPNGALAGAVYYKDISAVSLQPGESIAADVTTAAAGGSAAGDGYVLIQEAEENPDVVANLSNHVASA